MATEVDSRIVASRVEQGETLPASWYTDEAFFALERDELLRQVWSYACHGDEVSEPGSVVPVDINGAPVLVTRDRSGELRAFYNVCRHRGHILVDQPSVRTSIQCPYHAWTYKLDGELTGVPRGSDDSTLDQRQYGLRALRVAEWRSLVFVTENDEAPAFTEVTAPVDAALDEAGIDPARYRFRARTSHVLNANWKAFVENSLECYHCPVAHPGFSSRVDVRPDRYRIERLGDHGRHAGVLRDGTEFHFYFLWPMFMFSWVEAELGLIHARPLSADRTLVISEYCYPEGTPEETMQANIDQGELTLSEDASLVASVQRGLQSGAIEAGRFLAGAEDLLQHFNTVLVRRMQ